MEDDLLPGFDSGFPATFPPEPLSESSEAKLMNAMALEQEPTQSRQGPWWRELLSSPVKRLCRTNWNNPFGVADTPIFRLPPPSAAPVKVESHEDEGVESSPPLKRRRNDIPDSKRRTVLNTPKSGLRGAVAWAKSKEARERAVKNLETAFYANSSRAAKSSKRKTIMDIMTAAKESYPLTAFSIKLIAATLKEAGYKSAYTYLIEATSYHLEQGHEWTHSLDRWFKLSINAAKRGMDPGRKLGRSQRAIGPTSPSSLTTGPLDEGSPPNASVCNGRALDAERDRSSCSDLQRCQTRQHEQDGDPDLDGIQNGHRSPWHLPDDAVHLRRHMRPQVPLCSDGSAGQSCST